MALLRIWCSLYTTLMVTGFTPHKGLVEQKPYAMIVAYVFAALGVLTKGPVAIVLPGMILICFAGINRPLVYGESHLDWRASFSFCSLFAVVCVHVQCSWSRLYQWLLRASQCDSRLLNRNIQKIVMWWYYPAIFLGASMPWTVLLFTV